MKICFFLLLSVFLIFSVSIDVYADFGPKPFVEIDITGMEDINYTATLISKVASGPNFFYEDYLEMSDPWMEYHPIMEYEDSEGFKWIGRHWEMQGNGKLEWGYYPPKNFKLLIMTEDNKYYTSNELERYAFASYFQVDLSDVIGGENSTFTVIKSVSSNFNYFKEIPSFFFRLIFTIAIEIGIAFLFGFRKKNQMITILIVNLVTQIFLNVMLNITTYFEGWLTAMFFFFIAEIFVLFFEMLFYIFYFKNQKTKAALYSLVANLISCALGFGLYILEIGYLK